MIGMSSRKKTRSTLQGLFALLALWVLAGCAGSGGPVLPPSEEELTGLMNHGIGMARSRLETGQDVYPFALVKTTSGRMERVEAPGTETPQDEIGGIVPAQDRTAGQALAALEAQVAATQAREGKYQAVAFFAETFIELKNSGMKTDAVEVSLEGSDGYCANVFYPFSKLTQGEVVMGKPVRTTRKEGRVFGGCK